MWMGGDADPLWDQMDKILVVCLPESVSVNLNQNKWTHHSVPHVDVMALRYFTLLLMLKFMKRGIGVPK